MFGLKNVIQSLGSGQILIPIPKAKWMEQLDMDRPFDRRCSVCGGEMYFAKDRIDVVACSCCGLAYLLVVIANPLTLTDEMIESLKRKHLMNM